MHPLAASGLGHVEDLWHWIKACCEGVPPPRYCNPVFLIFQFLDFIGHSSILIVYEAHTHTETRQKVQGLTSRKEGCYPVTNDMFFETSVILSCPDGVESLELRLVFLENWN